MKSGDELILMEVVSLTKDKAGVSREYVRNGIMTLFAPNHIDFPSASPSDISTSKSLLSITSLHHFSTLTFLPYAIYSYLSN